MEETRYFVLSCLNVCVEENEGLINFNPFFPEPISLKENNNVGFLYCEKIAEFVSKNFTNIEVICFISKTKTETWDESFSPFKVSSSEEEKNLFLKANHSKIVAYWFIETRSILKPLLQLSKENKLSTYETLNVTKSFQTNDSTCWFLPKLLNKETCELMYSSIEFILKQ